MFRPRPKQQEILNYESGWMGISAVPGSGKTYTLSALAAQIIQRGLLKEGQEVLVVTLVNSAVHNFASRIGRFVEERGGVPNLDYRVRTLHGLAHDIVREHPGLVGLSDDFDIIDERAADEIRREVAEAWVRAHPDAVDDYLSPEVQPDRRDWVRRGPWPQLVSDMARSFIRTAKDHQVTVAQLRDRLDDCSLRLPLAEMGCAIYAQYQRALAYRGAVDFDDLIRLALLALRLDEVYRRRLQERWPFILEDEAQDSSRVQEEILRMLVGLNGNWVRVGDPNQAIYETFTTASPQHLLRFLDEPHVAARELPNSGRSTRSIINLANHLIRWTRTDHPVASLRDALALPYVLPTPEGDPQPNPPDEPEQVHLIGRSFTPLEELSSVVRSVAQWLPDHAQETVAVLVPRNERGFEVIRELKRHNIDCVELLRSTQSTRLAAGALGNIVNYLADPASSSRLATVYRVWQRGSQGEDAKSHTDAVAKALRGCTHVEDFLWPRSGRDWLEEADLSALPGAADQLLTFRGLVRRWQGATLLPIDQLILTLAQDLFQEPSDLAVAHKLAGLLRGAAETHPEWQLPELTAELGMIARNERRFLGLSDDETGFDPEKHRGKVVVATVHKAKGLEWDRVYLMSVNNYSFPSLSPHDTYISEKWFIRDGLNLEAESLAQFEALHPGASPGRYVEGEATRKARRDYAAERLRLLYVGITRAKKELIITWNTGRRQSNPSTPAVPLLALQTYWEAQQHELAE